MDRINQQGVFGLLALMTPDRRLIDPGGGAVSGRPQLGRARRGYLA